MIRKKVLLFTGGKGKIGKENFAHTAQLYLALKDNKGVDLRTYEKKSIFSKDFFSNKNDLIISVGFLSAYFVLMKKFKMIKCPVLHSWNDDYHKCGGVGGKFLRKAVEYWTVKNADYNLTCSKYRFNIAKNLGRDIEFIPHGVVDDWDSIKGKKLNGINLLYFGEFSSVKGSNRIINLAKKFPKLNFHFFGRTKKNEEKIIKNLPKNIIFHGWVDNKEAISYCKGADILLHPTDNDSTLKIYSYIKSGKIILALKGQINYLLEHKKNAYIIEDFEKGIKEILHNKNLQEKLKGNLKKIKIYYWREIRNEYNKFINKIIKNDGAF